MKDFFFSIKSFNGVSRKLLFHKSLKRIITRKIEECSEDVSGEFHRSSNDISSKSQRVLQECSK